MSKAKTNAPCPKCMHFKKQGWVFNKKVSAMIIGAFSFVVAFGISSTARSIFEENVGLLDRSKYWAIYTVIAFIIAVLVINALWRYVEE